jgi:hypothetical protein
MLEARLSGQKTLHPDSHPGASATFPTPHYPLPCLNPVYQNATNATYATKAKRIQFEHRPEFPIPLPEDEFQ